MNAGDNDGPQRPAQTPPPRRQVAVVAGIIDSRDLFTGTRELTITHGKDTYRLRLTAQNKLILTK